MQYNEAKTVKVGDTLLIKQSNYRSTHVLEITHNSLYHTFRFRCTDGEFYHKELSLPMPNEKLIGGSASLSSSLSSVFLFVLEICLIARQIAAICPTRTT